MKSDSPPTRTYRQSARAQAAAANADRIVETFVSCLQEMWFDEIRLDDVARDAGVTVQTVIRRFGGKDGLLDAASTRMSEQILSGRRASVRDVGGAIDAIIEEYENIGELMMRLLSQETRYPAVRRVTDLGRGMHRQWVGLVFDYWLDLLPEPARTEAHDRLVIALDIYVWKLLRVDVNRSRSDLRRAMLAMCASALDLEPGDLERRPALQTET